MTKINIKQIMGNKGFRFGLLSSSVYLLIMLIFSQQLYLLKDFNMLLDSSILLLITAIIGYLLVKNKSLDKFNTLIIPIAGITINNIVYGMMANISLPMSYHITNAIIAGVIGVVVGKYIMGVKQ